MKYETKKYEIIVAYNLNSRHVLDGDVWAESEQVLGHLEFIDSATINGSVAIIGENWFFWWHHSKHCHLPMQKSTTFRLMYMVWIIGYGISNAMAWRDTILLFKREQIFQASNRLEIMYCWKRTSTVQWNVPIVNYE